jgi:hypothetical protein
MSLVGKGKEENNNLRGGYEMQSRVAKHDIVELKQDIWFNSRN